MASSSKSINMPLIFAISIGATVSLVAIVMFGLAWYAYEDQRVLSEQVFSKPTHTSQYDDVQAEQEANLGAIEQAMAEVAAEQKPDDHDHDHGHGGHAVH